MESLVIPGVTATPASAAMLTGGILFLVLLWKPIVRLIRLLARTGTGLALLAVFAPVGRFFGVTLGVNLFNALVLGVLGVPGFGLLLMLNWVLM